MVSDGVAESDDVAVVYARLMHVVRSREVAETLTIEGALPPDLGHAWGVYAAVGSVAGAWWAS